MGFFIGLHHGRFSRVPCGGSSGAGCCEGLFVSKLFCFDVKQLAFLFLFVSARARGFRGVVEIRDLGMAPSLPRKNKYLARVWSFKRTKKQRKIKENRRKIGKENNQNE
jgi:hypothetical protein